MSTINYHVKVQTAGSGHKYFLDDGSGFTEAPMISMLTTKTYVFTVADTSMTSHPFSISTSSGTNRVADVLSSDSNATITGSQGISSQGSSLSITIPSTSTYIGTNLHYVCGLHAGLGNSIAVSEICFPENMKVRTINRDKNIQDLIRGEFIETNNNTFQKLARLVINKKECDVEFIEFKPHSISPNVPNKKLLVTPPHPIYYNRSFREAKSFVNGKDINLVKQYTKNIYNIQFETEEIVYVNNIPFMSHNPNHFVEPLPKQLYFNKTLFDLKKYRQYDNPTWYK